MVASSSPLLVYRVPSRLLSLKQCVASGDLYAIKYVFSLWGAVHAVVTIDERKGLVYSILQFLLQSTTQTEYPVLKKWFEVADAGIQALFLLTSRFDVIVGKLVREIMAVLISSKSSGSVTEEVHLSLQDHVGVGDSVSEGEALGISSKASDVPEVTTTTPSNKNAPSEETNETTSSLSKVNESCLTRFFFLLGSLSLKLLQFVEETAARAKKARHQFEEKNRGKTHKENECITQADDFEDMILERINKKGIVIKYGCQIE